MESFNDIKNLWHSDTEVSLPNVREIEAVISQFTKTNKRKYTVIIFLLFCCLAALLILIAFAPFQLWTTYIGLSIFMGVAVYSIYLKMKTRRRFSNFETLTNTKYLEALEKEESETCSGKSKKIAMLFIIWAIGFGFYIFEFTRESPQWLLAGYGCLIILIAGMWFVYRPFMRKRYQKQIQKTIEKIQKLKTQTYEKE